VCCIIVFLIIQISIPGGVLRKNVQNKYDIAKSIANSEQCNHNSVRRFIGWFIQELNKVKKLLMET